MVYYGAYYGLLRKLRFFYYENYGAFTRDLFTLNILSQIGPESPTFGDNLPKSDFFYCGYYRICSGIFYHGIFRKITVRNVPLPCIDTPKPKNPKKSQNIKKNIKV
jgi:hypothetical protein